MAKILLVGCGNMGYAMLKGWTTSPGHEFFVIEPNEELRARAATTGAATFTNIEDKTAFDEPDFVFLAVKPQVMADVARRYARFSGACFISIAAGIDVASLKAWLRNDRIVRTMPNTPAAIGEGMIVSYATDAVNNTERDAIDGLLAGSGETAWIDNEDLMDAVTAISGSGPAYVFLLIEALAEAAKKLGLGDELAIKLAQQTVKGAGKLAANSEIAPGQLRKQVTSPGGTTAAALNVLMRKEDGLCELIEKAAGAARDRGRELGKS